MAISSVPPMVAPGSTGLNGVGLAYGFLRISA